MTEIDPKIHAKIAALLRKAERTDNEAEASAFSAKAEELLMKWNIERAQIELEENHREAIVQKRMTFPGTSGRTRRDFIELCFRVTQGLGGLKAFRMPNFEPENRGRDLEDLLIIGHESDVDAAIWLATSILLQGQIATTAWWKAQGIPSIEITGGQRAKLKSSFMTGFGSRVEDRLTALRTRLVEEAGTGTDLVFVGRDALVKAYVEEKFPKLRKGRTRQVSAGAYYQGQAAGDRADLGQTRVKNPGRKALS